MSETKKLTEEEYWRKHPIGNPLAGPHAGEGKPTPRISDDPSLQREKAEPAVGFWGTVMVGGDEVVAAPNGTWCSGFYGYVKILPADIMGMKPARGDSPFVAQVSGKEEDVWVPGCKVAAVNRGRSHIPADYMLTGRSEHNSQGLDIWEVP